MSTDAVRARLAEISERELAAAKGPWTVRGVHGWQDLRAEDDDWLVHAATGHELTPGGGEAGDYGMVKADADFIAAARSDVPALVAAVNAVLEMCEKAENRPFRGIDFSGKPFPVHVSSGELLAAVAAALGVTE